MVKWHTSEFTKDKEPFGYYICSVQNIAQPKWWGASVIRMCGTNPSHKWKALVFTGSKASLGMNVAPDWPASGQGFNDVHKAQKACEDFLKQKGFDLTKAKSNGNNKK